MNNNKIHSFLLFLIKVTTIFKRNAHIASQLLKQTFQFTKHDWIHIELYFVDNKLLKYLFIDIICSTVILLADNDNGCIYGYLSIYNRIICFVFRIYRGNMLFMSALIPNHIIYRYMTNKIYLNYDLDIRMINLLFLSHLNICNNSHIDINNL